MKRLFRDVRGQALIETALTLPLMLLLSISVVEFGRAFQCWELLTNAAREGARIAVLPGVSDTAVRTRVQTYLTGGQLTNTPTITIARNTSISIGASTTTGSTVTVTYPFSFMVLRPLTLLVASETTLSNSITMKASSTMRNE